MPKNKRFNAIITFIIAFRFVKDFKYLCRIVFWGDKRWQGRKTKKD